MKRNQVKFTEQYLKKLSHARPIDKHGNPTDRKYFADPETTGLYFYVRCLAGGGLTCKWIFRMQPSQRIQKPLKTVLGTYPDMKYIEARLKALSILSQGILPSAQSFRQLSQKSFPFDSPTTHS